MSMPFGLNSKYENYECNLLYRYFLKRVELACHSVDGPKKFILPNHLLLKVNGWQFIYASARTNQCLIARFLLHVLKESWYLACRRIELGWFMRTFGARVLRLYRDTCDILKCSVYMVDRWHNSNRVTVFLLEMLLPRIDVLNPLIVGEFLILDALNAQAASWPNNMSCQGRISRSGFRFNTSVNFRDTLGPLVAPFWRFASAGWHA